MFLWNNPGKIYAFTGEVHPDDAFTEEVNSYLVRGIYLDALNAGEVDNSLFGYVTTSCVMLSYRYNIDFCLC